MAPANNVRVMCARVAEVMTIKLASFEFQDLNTGANESAELSSNRAQTYSSRLEPLVRDVVTFKTVLNESADFGENSKLITDLLKRQRISGSVQRLWTYSDMMP